MAYFCSKCSAPVEVNGEEKIRSCDCNSSIIASLEGEAHGHGGIKA